MKASAKRNGSVRGRIARTFFFVLVCLLCVLLLAACGSTENEENKLKYTLNSSQDGYIMDCNGIYRAEKLVIPAEHNGLPVVGISSQAFYNSPNLKEVEFLTVGNMTIDSNVSGAFEGCPALKRVVFSGETIGNLTIDDKTFKNCPALETVSFGNENATVDRLSIGKKAFIGCTNLKTLVWVGGENAQISISDNAFEKCSSLEEVSFGTENTTVDAITIGKKAFIGCTNLKTLFFTGNEDTQITIGDKAFFDSTSIENMTFVNGHVTYNANYGSFSEKLWVKILNVGSADISVADPLYTNCALKAREIHISGGSLTSYNPIEKIYIGENSSHTLIGQNVKISEAFLADGFFFDHNNFLLHYYKTGVFNVETHYLPYAEYIHIPLSVASIPEGFFGDEGECTVYYGATLENWTSVTLVSETGNKNLLEHRVNVITAEEQNFTVRFLAPDGTEIGQAVEVPYGTKITSPKLYDTITQKCVGWYEDADFTDPWNFDAQTIQKNTVLYAKLVDSEELSKAELIDFKGMNSENGEFSQRFSSSTESIILWDKITISPYAYSYFSKDIDGNDRFDHEINLSYGENVCYLQVTSGDGQTTNTYTIHLYRNYVYKITFRPENGSDPITTEVEEGNKLQAPKCARQGYELDGWYLGDQKIDFSVFTADEDRTLSARWTPLTYEISFPENPELSPVSIAYGQTHKLPIPEKAHYRFEGWVTDKGVLFTDGKGQMKSAYEMLTSLTLTARFTPVTYTVNYYNTEEISHTNPTTYTVEDGKILLSPMHREWFSFTGWYSDASKTKPIREIDTSEGGDLTLYAGWEMISYKVYYYADGELVAQRSFTHGYQSWTVPAVPAKKGYTGQWSDYTVGPHDIYVYAEYTPKTYEITYMNLNRAENPNPTQYTAGDSPIALEKLNREWYTFMGWYLDAELTRPVYEIPTDTLENIYLYAGWKPVEFTAYYYADGQVVHTHVFQHGAEIWNNPAVPQKEHYVGAWSSFIVSSQDLHIHAVYTPKNYTITYENTAGVYHNNPTVYHIETTEFHLTPLTRKGYTFLGWYLDGQKTESIPQGTSGHLSLEARWEAVSYTVTYENTKGASLEGLPQSYTIQSPELYLQALSLEHYTFDGWYDQAEKKVTSIPAGSTGDITLTAVFVPVTYSITYEGIEGASHENPSTYTFETPAIPLTPLARKGYTFLGWYLDGKKTESIPQGTSGHLTLEARWEAVSYTITYENTKGVSIEGLPHSYTIQSPELYLQALSLEHYTFDGWYDQAWKKVTSIPVGSTGDITLTAVFIPVTYSITYEGIGGASHENPATYTVENSDILLQNATKAGYRFLGWYMDGEQVETVPSGTHGHLTLTAQWEFAVYSITYENLKGADTSMLPSEYTIESDRILLPTLSVPHYQFNGWRNEKGQTVSAIPRGSYGDIILTANFTPVSYQIVYQNTLGVSNPNPSSYHIDTETFTLSGLSKEGYRFLGWFENDQPVDVIEKGSFGQKTFVAKWTPEIYSITYENTYDLDVSVLPREYTVESDAISLPTVFIKGFTFNGWRMNGRLVHSIPKGTTGHLVLSADLSPAQYTLILEPLGGTLKKNEYTVTYGNMTDLPVPKQEGKVFLGWFDNTGTIATQYTDENGKALITYKEYAGRVLYARWATVICTVTFFTDGGTAVETMQYPYGTAFDAEIVSEKENAMFDGWYTSDMSVEYTATTIIKSDVTLHAKWIESIPISNAQEFLAIAQNPGLNYYLTNDINLKGNIWTPIAEFSGTLDGCGYTVKNFLLTATSVGSTYGMIYKNTGIIKNLTLHDFTFNISTSNNETSVGVLVGLNQGLISNCSMTAGLIKVTSTMNNVNNAVRFGCFAGSNTGTISNSTSNAEISFTGNGQNFVSGYSGTSYPVFQVGGLVGNNTGKILYSSYCGTMAVVTSAEGYNSYGSSRSCSSRAYLGGVVGVNDYGGVCYASFADAELRHSSWKGSYGSLTSYVGGLAGYNANEAKIESCYSAGILLGGNVDGTYFGGLVGINTSKAEIVGCYSKADIESDRGGSIGGLVGQNEAVIQNSYAVGDVSSTASVNIAALVGRNTSLGTIFKCYASGNVSAPGGNCKFFAGVNEGVFSKCYYLRGTSLLIGGVYYTHVIEYETVEGLTHGDLWSQEFLVNKMYWDEEGWIILINDDPMLDWEIAIGHDYEISVVEPTCDEYGYSLYVCKHCNRFFVRDFVLPYGHERSEIIVIAPTCTAEGYTMYTCNRCDKVETTEHIPPLGHDWSEGEHQDATCYEDGFDKYLCRNCGEEKTIAISAAHVPVISIQRQVPVCIKHIHENGTVTYETTNGHTEEIVCSACTDEQGNPTVLTPSVIIPPHDFDVAATSDPTCTETGYGTYTCKICGYSKSDVIPAMGHTDVNMDLRCDTCGELCGNFEALNAIHITTVEQLLAVSENLNGIYVLDADISLYNVNWTPIGTKEQPFTGYFYGNGHKIKNLSVNNTEIGGIFGYTTGIIDNLTLENLEINQVNVNGTVGGIAAYNMGLIVNCQVTGSIHVTSGITLSINDYAIHRVAVETVIGGVVGINEHTGVIRYSTNRANVECGYFAESIVNSVGNISSLLTRKYATTQADVTLTGVFGGFVGRNNGVVDSCGIEGSVKQTIKNAYTDIRGYKGLFNVKIGLARAVQHVYIGAFVGINTGTITDYTHNAALELDHPVNIQDPANTKGTFFETYAENNVYTDYNSNYLFGMNAEYGIIEK